MQYKAGTIKTKPKRLAAKDVQERIVANTLIKKVNITFTPLGLM